MDYTTQAIADLRHQLGAGLVDDRVGLVDDKVGSVESRLDDSQEAINQFMVCPRMSLITTCSG